MGIRLELLLIVLIVTMLSLAYTIRLSDETQVQNRSSKEMEFTYTTFTEVNREKQIGTASGTYGVREAGVLKMYNLRYHTEAISRLLSDEGRYIGEKLYLDGNVTMMQKEGYLYTAEHAIYNKTTGVLTILSPFTAHMDKNIIKGASAIYDTHQKILTAKKINAVLFSVESTKACQREE